MDTFFFDNQAPNLWEHTLEEYLQKSVKTLLTALSFTNEVGIILTNDAQIKLLNNQWRGKNKPTNVLSFPDEEGGGVIYLSHETIEQEAIAQGKLLTHHAAHLLIHGCLHLKGYTHQQSEEVLEGDTYKMQQQEILLLAKLGICDPYKNS